MSLMEVITVELSSETTLEAFLPANKHIENEYVSKQPGFLSRETAVSDAGQLRIVVYWVNKANSDASIAGFGGASGLDAFMGNLEADTMAIKQYKTLISTSGQTRFPGSGATEVITVKLQDGADREGFLAANEAIESAYVSQQPGYIAREVAVNEDGEWLIVVHWESAADSAASIAKFDSAPGVEEFMSYMNMETMAITVYQIQ